VVTARRPDDPGSCAKGVPGSPSFVEFVVANAELTTSQAVRVDLYENGLPVWRDLDVKRGIDVAVIPLSKINQAFPFPVSSTFAANSVKRLEPGIDLTIVGFPFTRRTDFTPLPIWKRAMLATEPYLSDPAFGDLLLDSPANPGMSGSPIYRTSVDYFDGPDQLAAEEAVIRGELEPLEASVIGFQDMSAREIVALELVGIYAGATGFEELEKLQLGRAFSVETIERIITEASSGWNPFPPD
jgi:hypothetical protein